MSTTFEGRATILAEFGSEDSTGEEWADWAEEHAEALELARCLDRGLAVASEAGVELLEECWADLLKELDCEDTGFASLDDLLDDWS